jgi:hypothetical protein
MPRATKYISLEGTFASGVLGVFKVIRGFADIRRLAEISIPYAMQEGPDVGRVAGHQRQLDGQHAKDIRDYLENSDSRFFPEVILSVRTVIEEISNPSGDVLGVSSEGDDGVFISRRFSGKNHRTQNVHVLRRRLDEIKRTKLIRRIDGNHRLALADELIDDPNLPGKYLAPFCLVLLGAPDDAADDFAESLIFHTINSTAMQLESEHGLKLLLGQDAEYSMTPDNEFAYSPELHLTRLLRDHIQRLPHDCTVLVRERGMIESRLCQFVTNRDDPFLVEIAGDIHFVSPVLVLLLILANSASASPNSMWPSIGSGGGSLGSAGGPFNLFPPIAFRGGYSPNFSLYARRPDRSPTIALFLPSSSSHTSFTGAHLIGSLSFRYLT